MCSGFPPTSVRRTGCTLPSCGVYTRLPPDQEVPPGAPVRHLGNRQRILYVHVSHPTLTSNISADVPGPQATRRTTSSASSSLKMLLLSLMAFLKNETTLWKGVLTFQIGFLAVRHKEEDFSQCGGTSLWSKQCRSRGLRSRPAWATGD